MTHGLVTSARIKKIDSQHATDVQDLLAAEEPLEIRIAFGTLNDRHQKGISVTMRTPGNDFELALGFLFTEGIIHGKKDVFQIKYCTDLNRLENKENIVRVELNADIAVDLKKLERHFYTTSSCGVCGKASIESIATVHEFSGSDSGFTVDKNVLLSLPEKIREKQKVFEHTGGLHAAALFDEKGTLVLIREDVGRHNALDKLIGASFSSGHLPLNHHILLLSGRVSFELIQKAVMAGVHVIAAIGAPSSLAVETAKKFNTTLIGFLRMERFNIYSGEQRINYHSKKEISSKIL